MTSVENPSKNMPPMDITQLGTSIITNFDQIVDKDSATGN